MYFLHSIGSFESGTLLRSWFSQNTQLEQAAGENWGKLGRQWASLLWLWPSSTPAVERQLGRVTKAPSGRGFFCRREESVSVSSELSYCCLYTIVFSQSTVPSTKKTHVREKQSSINLFSSLCLFLGKKWNSLSMLPSIAAAWDLAGELWSLCSWELLLEPNFVQYL